jgi:hypothetical protein
MSISRYSTRRAIVKEYQADVVAVAFGKKTNNDRILTKGSINYPKNRAYGKISKYPSFFLYCMMI